MQVVGYRESVRWSLLAINTMNDSLEARVSRRWLSASMDVVLIDSMIPPFTYKEVGHIWWSEMTDRVIVTFKEKIYDMLQDSL